MTPKKSEDFQSKLFYIDFDKLFEPFQRIDQHSSLKLFKEKIIKGSVLATSKHFSQQLNKNNKTAETCKLFWLCYQTCFKTKIVTNKNIYDTHVNSSLASSMSQNHGDSWTQGSRDGDQFCTNLISLIAISKDHKLTLTLI